MFEPDVARLGNCVVLDVGQQRVLPREVLMEILGRIECGERLEPGHDAPRVDSLALQLVELGLGFVLLLVGGEKNCRD